jgi:N-acetylglucosamine-6-phosphate deacetylase
MNTQQIKIYNGKIITPEKIISNGSILITGNKIAEVSEQNIKAPDAMQIDAGEKYIAPGFIDIHVHGGGDHDFMDGTETAFLKAAELHVQYGTTLMTPTTLSSSKEELLQMLSLYESANAKNTKGAQFAGIHLEGPYISMNQRGAQDPRFIRNPDPEEYKDILSNTSSVQRWSAAPEL